MTVIESILMGILQGILEFLPVSSFGHVTVLEQFMDIPVRGALLFETLLHVGTLSAVLIVFHKDVRRILEELIGIVMDLIANLHIWFLNRHSATETLPFNKIISSIYRKMTLLLLLSTCVTAILGFTIRNLALLSRRSAIAPGIMLLITGVLLIVTDFSKAGGRVTSPNARYDHAIWIGIAQGLSVFPGISRLAFTVCIALFCGFDRRLAVKYSFLVSIPAVIGALIVEIPAAAGADLAASQIWTFVPGMIAAGLVGYLVIRRLLKITQNLRLSLFAAYCFAAGIVSLILL